MSGENIQGVGVNNKLVAMGGGEIRPFDPTIEQFTTILINLDRYNFPDNIRDLAFELNKADKHLRVAETQFKLAQEQERLGAISKDKIDEAKNKVETCSSKVGKLFAQVKQEYESWYDKNVPENLKKAWIVLFETDINIQNLHFWFKTHTYDLTKNEIVSIKA